MLIFYLMKSLIQKSKKIKFLKYTLSERHSIQLCCFPVRDNSVRCTTESTSCSGKRKKTAWLLSAPVSYKIFPHFKTLCRETPLPHLIELRPRESAFRTQWADYFVWFGQMSIHFARNGRDTLKIYSEKHDPVCLHKTGEIRKRAAALSSF